MKQLPTALPDVLLFEPEAFGDSRGYFFELFNAEHYKTHGLAQLFVQDNVSQSQRGVLRGLHMQHPHGQGKFVTVLQGTIVDVAVDVRVGSPHFGQHVMLELNDKHHHQLYIPPGFLHGFMVLSETVLMHYKCTDYYHPESELTVRWDDPDLAIAWPASYARILSAKDQAGVAFAELDHSRLPRYEESHVISS